LHCPPVKPTVADLIAAIKEHEVSMSDPLYETVQLAFGRAIQRERELQSVMEELEQLRATQAQNQGQVPAKVYVLFDWDFNSIDDVYEDKDDCDAAKSHYTDTREYTVIKSSKSKPVVEPNLPSVVAKAEI
jgi:hypothetical protein